MKAYSNTGLQRAVNKRAERDRSLVLELSKALYDLLELHSLDAEGKPMARWFSDLEVEQRTIAARKALERALPGV